MDINDVATGKGGFYAVDAATGTMNWFFDPESGSVCRPDATDEIRAYDGYHSEAELGLPVRVLRDAVRLRPPAYAVRLRQHLVVAGVRRRTRGCCSSARATATPTTTRARPFRRRRCRRTTKRSSR